MNRQQTNAKPNSVRKRKRPCTADGTPCRPVSVIHPNTTTATSATLTRIPYVPARREATRSSRSTMGKSVIRPTRIFGERGREVRSWKDEDEPAKTKVPVHQQQRHSSKEELSRAPEEGARRSKRDKDLTELKSGKTVEIDFDDRRHPRGQQVRQQQPDHQRQRPRAKKTPA